MSGACDVLERAQHALAELGARVRVGELLAGGDQVRLHERAPAGPEVELLQTLAHDRADALRVVGLAVPDDDVRCRPVRVHAPEPTAPLLVVDARRAHYKSRGAAHPHPCLGEPAGGEPHVLSGHVPRGGARGHVRPRVRRQRQPLLALPVRTRVQSGARPARRARGRARSFLRRRVGHLVRGPRLVALRRAHRPARRRRSSASAAGTRRRGRRRGRLSHAEPRHRHR